MYHILIVTKDASPFVELVQLFKKDYFVVEVSDVDQVYTQSEQLDHYDFILLNLENRGIFINQELITIIKSSSKAPLYVLSKGLKEIDKANYLDFGAEGHVGIPFSALILKARIKAVIRFINNLRKTPKQTLRIGNLLVRLDNHEVYLDGQSVQLTNVEFKILKLLLEHKDTVVSKDQIISHVWNDELSATDNALGIHITRLRKKLICDPNIQLIETVWGLGYRLNYKKIEHVRNFNAFQLSKTK